MNLPFTIEQFLDVFAHYNLSIWPVQIILNLLAVAGIFMAIKKTKYSDQTIGIILSLFWLWMGIVYHLSFFTAINPAAYLFGSLFILQGLLFLWHSVFKSNLSFKFKANLYGICGSLFLFYALIAYPIIGALSGHAYPKAPTFGAPCPTTIFTFGLLLWTEKKVKKTILIIPLLWSVIGFSAAVNLSIREDFGLVVAGILGTLLLILLIKPAFLSLDA